jgi:sphingomyelin phosphodiesterase acid-like 3
MNVLRAKIVSALVMVLGFGSVGMAQEKPAPSARVPVLMLSDIHFDPFHDPAKVEQLRAAKVEVWEQILTAPDSATKAADWDRVQTTCNSKGIDTPAALLFSSLAAEKQAQPQPLFVTVSGDLMAHQFDCKFKTIAPKASEADYSAFAAKTVAFVAWELHKTFLQSPLYLALGNNDSGCKDYAEDRDSAFLKNDARTFATVTMNAKNASTIEREFSDYGDYSVLLPAPMVRTRLLVLQDIFESKKFLTCAGTPDKTSAAVQIGWLQRELAAAKSAHEKVWVMAHIPPGIDAYAAYAKGEVCGGSKVSMFLKSTDLADVLEQYADTITLALFGHTHMDEMKLLHGDKGAAVPAKLVPSITPVDGNLPAFTLASVDPARSVLVDYTVYEASNKTGEGTKWTPEYTYSSTYQEPDFSSASVDQLMAKFVADRNGSSDTSHAYQNFYYVGGMAGESSLKAAAMHVMWHGYVCSMAVMDPGAFRQCACSK